MGGLPGWFPVRRALAAPGGGHGNFGRLPTLPLVCFFAPIPPPPFPAGRGRILLYFAGGFAPGTPALNRLRHLQSLPNRYPAQPESLRFNAKPTERVPYEQCR